MPIYIYIYIGPDLHALYADPPSLAFLCSVAFFLLNSRSLSPRNVAPPSQSPWQGPCARRTLPHHEDKMKPYSVRAETRIGISGPAYEGARTKRKTNTTLSLSLALALAGRFHFNPPASPVSNPLVIESAAREILCQGEDCVL